MLHYSIGLICWLRGMIKGEKQYCQMHTDISKDIDYSQYIDGAASFILYANGIPHKVSVRPMVDCEVNEYVSNQAEKIANG